MSGIGKHALSSDSSQNSLKKSEYNIEDHKCGAMDCIKYSGIDRFYMRTSLVIPPLREPTME
jgi:hypothetical protein